MLPKKKCILLIGIILKCIIWNPHLSPCARYLFQLTAICHQSSMHLQLEGEKKKKDMGLKYAGIIIQRSETLIWIHYSEIHIKWNRKQEASKELLTLSFFRNAHLVVTRFLRFPIILEHNSTTESVWIWWHQMNNNTDLRLCYRLYNTHQQLHLQC